MPQLFQVLKCYKCSIFQVHQTKKSIKWECKLCGEKQSIKRHYGLGTGKECRLHVQKLNGIRGEVDELSQSVQLNHDSDFELENSAPNIDVKPLEKRKLINESKWSNFVDKELSTKSEPNNGMYLGDTEVVLEVPVKKIKKFKAPTSTNEPLSYELTKQHKSNSNKLKYNYTPNETQSKTSKLEVSSDYKKIFKTNSSQLYTSCPNPETSAKETASQDIYNTKNEIKQPNKDYSFSRMKTYVPPEVNTNSKWAEFANEPDENESISRENSFENMNEVVNRENLSENMSLTQENCSKREARFLENVTKHLFQQCSDNELDNLLEF